MTKHERHTPGRLNGRSGGNLCVPGHTREEGMRSPEELIRELKLEGEKFDTVAILVVFENHTLPVYSIDTEALENLKELIQKGGEPIGLIFLTSRGEGIAYGTRPFQEYAKEDWAIARLQGYIERLTKFMEADGVQTFPYPTKNQKE